ncbi:hypothetical protein [Streptomyces yaizuensis]|uniref:Uncharacterized protein n=1 Tax=Streptomyces yaizuensis TaxID=2989713 RepID=A0ABQ5P942_9ACTN|nr:hypothetical protein [Streptomyces sp. YSPA8]GLF99108.1 hypothetical protein SYYSPA8_32445 [Streptomyces sp. YSPA8]
MAPDRASALKSTRVDAHRTWVAGLRTARLGNGLITLRPALWERDERVGPGWKQLPTVPVEANSMRFNDVDAVSPDAALVVGDNLTGGGIVTQRWDGTRWRTEPAPSAPDAIGGGLLAVDARTPGDAWAVGWQQVPMAPDTSRHVGVIQRWNGTEWKPAHLPDVGEGPAGEVTLWDVVATGRDTAWAVGNLVDGAGAGAGAEPLVLRFDGTRWHKEQLPSFAGIRAGLESVTAGPDGTVWAVGRKALGGGVRSGLVLRYDGRSWTEVPVPDDVQRIHSVAFAGGAPVVVATVADAFAGQAPRVLRYRHGSWGSLELPGAVDGAPLSAWHVSAHSDGLDVAGSLPSADGQELGPAVVLSLRR